MIKEHSIRSQLTQSVPKSQGHEHKNIKNFTHQNQTATIFGVGGFISVQSVMNATG